MINVLISAKCYGILSLNRGNINCNRDFVSVMINPFFYKLAIIHFIYIRQYENSSLQTLIETGKIGT